MMADKRQALRRERDKLCARIDWTFRQPWGKSGKAKGMRQDWIKRIADIDLILNPEHNPQPTER